jgi:chaperonin cofactor prefoldin
MRCFTKHFCLLYRMDKILKIEAQMQDGKALDEEQKVMYTTKSNVEKSLADLKAILTAFEEIPKEVGMYPI